MTVDFVAMLLAIAACLIIFGVWLWFRTKLPPHLLFSDCTLLDVGRPSLRVRGASVPRILQFLALSLFLVAFIDPHRYIPRSDIPGKAPEAPTPTEGIAIYLVLDQSGSMAEEAVFYDGSGRRLRQTKMNFLKEVTQDFVSGNSSKGLQGRPNDLLGLVAFARTAQVLVPLTLDRKSITDALKKLNVRADRDQDGTAIGYALFKTINMIAATRHYAEDLVKKGEPAYQIKNSVIILVTDGIQDPNPLDKDNPLRNMELLDAADVAVANDVKLYIINVEPRIASSEFSEYRQVMRLLAQYTGGDYYTISDNTSLQEIYADIDQIEKSTLPTTALDKSLMPRYFRRYSYAPLLITTALCFLIVSVIVSATWLRRSP
ncbi:MAG: VWA domain-containing protein [Chlamydiales bacterium]|nr:VWA domain-containing protein [Chlamydiia bacterium]MCP5507859.1 VWA domain-containing protein [Chlamydiales bacterium]